MRILRLLGWRRQALGWRLLGERLEGFVSFLLPSLVFWVAGMVLGCWHRAESYSFYIFLYFYIFFGLNCSAIVGDTCLAASCKKSDCFLSLFRLYFYTLSGWYDRVTKLGFI